MTRHCFTNPRGGFPVQAKPICKTVPNRPEPDDVELFVGGVEPDVRSALETARFIEEYKKRPADLVGTNGGGVNNEGIGIGSGLPREKPN